MRSSVLVALNWMLKTVSRLELTFQNRGDSGYVTRVDSANICIFPRLLLCSLSLLQCYSDDRSFFSWSFFLDFAEYSLGFWCWLWNQRRGIGSFVELSCFKDNYLNPDLFYCEVKEKCFMLFLTEVRFLGFAIFIMNYDLT